MTVIVEDAHTRCKKCGVDCLKITTGGITWIRPRKISFCKGYHLNAMHEKTNICRTVIKTKEQTG